MSNYRNITILGVKIARVTRAKEVFSHKSNSLLLFRKIKLIIFIQTFLERQMSLLNVSIEMK